MRSLVQLNKIKSLGFADKLENCKILEIYTIEKHLTNKDLQKIADALHNPISQSYKIDDYETETPFNFAVEIGFLPGVTDNVANTAKETIEDLLKAKFDHEKEGVYFSTLFLFEGPLSENNAKTIADLLHNQLIERAHIKSHEKFMSDKGMDVIVPRVHLQTKGATVDKIRIDNLSEDELIELGRKGIKNKDGSFRGPLALDLDSLNVIVDYFKKEERPPNDIELESIAQTWSEHCKHTIFAAGLDEDAKTAQKSGTANENNSLPDGLYKGLIKKATNEIRKAKGKKDFCVSVFKDNSGGIIFNENWVITDKAETHNSPSALDPFGGAITGIVGVNRDTIGFGKGAKPIANLYGYCFADPDDKEFIYKDKELKNPALLPRRIINGVVAGVNAGGNCSGIPTPQGWQYFDDRYKGKPLIFVGTIGIIPKYLNGQPSWEKNAKKGDKIVVLGGRVGQDGIHGATFSSEALSEGSPATAVQIGDPITQKKLSDVIVKEARDLCLYNSITDNGAGGISCSIPEMAKECGGCYVELDKVPLKYPNLEPWKIWVSESQERMTLSVPPEKVDQLFDLLQRRGVEATIVGEFNDSGRCVVTMNGEKIMDVDLEFLHEGLPRKHLKSTYTKPHNKEPEFLEPKDYDETSSKSQTRNKALGTQTTGKTLNKILIEMLKRKNICSYSYISYQYDHMVQGMATVYPLQGPGQVNGTASIITPILGSHRGIVISQGINPRYSDIDTYHMAACAIDTAVRNAVAVGGDIDYMALMDNFCWCSSDEEERLGQLKAAVKACYDYAVPYGTPFISGKDSMFNDFKGYDKNGNLIKISVPPTLLISSLSVIEDARKAVTMDPKIPGDLVYILGITKNELGASEYFAQMDKDNIGMNVPKVDAEKAISIYRTFKEAVDQELLASSFSIGFGGLAVALAKKAISGQLGLEIDLSAVPQSKDLEEISKSRSDYLLFSESQTRFLVTVSPNNKEKFEKLFGKVSTTNNKTTNSKIDAPNDKTNTANTPTIALIGKVTNTPSLIIKNKDKEIINIAIKDLDEAYKSPFKNY